MSKHFGKIVFALLVIVFMLSLGPTGKTEEKYLDVIRDEANWKAEEYIEAETLREALIDKYGNDDLYWDLHEEVISTPEIVDEVLDNCTFEW